MLATVKMIKVPSFDIPIFLQIGIKIAANIGIVENDDPIPMVIIRPTNNINSIVR